MIEIRELVKTFDGFAALDGASLTMGQEMPAYEPWAYVTPDNMPQS